MWVLKKLPDGSSKYLISEKRSYSVGRKTCDIILENDASISRKHCTLFIDKKENCPFGVSTTTGVWIVDEQSKYGTYLRCNNDWKKLNSNQNIKLSNGSILKFGLMENIFSIEYKPVIACTSGINAELKKELENILKVIDGELKSSWTKDCSIVIVNELTLTVKVVLALINGIPIVTSHYVQNFVDSVKNQSELPDYKNFMPELKESILDAKLISFDITNTRKELFKDKKFIIPTKRQLETLKEVVLSAGGKVELLSSRKSWEHLGEKNVIVIQPPIKNSVSDEINEAFKEISSFLKSRFGKRIIHESEIAQAVAYSSIEKYCNPESTFLNFKKIIDEPDPGILLVEETPYESQATIPSICIPSSSTGDQDNDNRIFNKMESFMTTLEKKRNHSPESEAFKKKLKNNESSVKENETGKNLDSGQKEVKETNTVATKKSEPKNSYITNFFKKQTEGSIYKSVSDKKSTFWNPDSDNNSHKRKSSTEEVSKHESSKRKKISDLSSLVEEAPEIRADDIGQLSEAVQKLNANRDNFSTLDYKDKNSDFSEKENHEIDFIEKETTKNFSKYEADDLNNTIFSSNLISSAYLNNDGTLIDPPHQPVNVKKFKKQLIYSKGEITLQKPIEEEISDEGWIVPHSLDFVFNKNFDS